MPKKVDHGERREDIAKIVASMLATDGVEKTTIREISRQSGYSRGFIEHYYASKSDLISDAIRWTNEQSLKRVEKCLKGLKGLAALRSLIKETLPITEQTRREWHIRMQFWGLSTVDEALQREQSRRIHIVEKMIIKFLQEARDLGEIRSDINMQAAADSMLHRAYGLSCNAVLRSDYFTPQRQLKALDYIMNELVR